MFREVQSKKSDFLIEARSDDASLQSIGDCLITLLDKSVAPHKQRNALRLLETKWRDERDDHIAQTVFIACMHDAQLVDTLLFHSEMDFSALFRAALMCSDDIDKSDSLAVIREVTRVTLKEISLLQQIPVRRSGLVQEVGVEDDDPFSVEVSIVPSDRARLSLLVDVFSAVPQLSQCSQAPTVLGAAAGDALMCLAFAADLLDRLEQRWLDALDALLALCEQRYASRRPLLASAFCAARARLDRWASVAPFALRLHKDRMGRAFHSLLRIDAAAGGATLAVALSFLLGWVSAKKRRKLQSSVASLAMELFPVSPRACYFLLAEEKDMSQCVLSFIRTANVDDQLLREFSVIAPSHLEVLFEQCRSRNTAARVLMYLVAGHERVLQWAIEENHIRVVCAAPVELLVPVLPKTMFRAVLGLHENSSGLLDLWDDDETLISAINQLERAPDLLWLVKKQLENPSAVRWVNLLSSASATLSSMPDAILPVICAKMESQQRLTEEILASESSDITSLLFERLSPLLILKVMEVSAFEYSVQLPLLLSERVVSLYEFDQVRKLSASLLPRCALNTVLPMIIKELGRCAAATHDERSVVAAKALVFSVCSMFAAYKPLVSDRAGESDVALLSVILDLGIELAENSRLSVDEENQKLVQGVVEMLCRAVVLGFNVWRLRPVVLRSALRLLADPAAIKRFGSKLLDVAEGALQAHDPEIQLAGFALATGILSKKDQFHKWSLDTLTRLLQNC